jgi:hypothetical protein
MHCTSCADGKVPDGAIFKLCDACFEVWVIEHDKRVAEHGRNAISDAEFVLLFGHAPKKDGN